MCFQSVCEGSVTGMPVLHHLLVMLLVAMQLLAYIRIYFVCFLMGYRVGFSVLCCM